MLARDLHADLTASDPANPGNRRGSFLTRRFNRIIILFPDRQPLHAAFLTFPVSPPRRLSQPGKHGIEARRAKQELPNGRRSMPVCWISAQFQGENEIFQKKEGKIKIRCSRARLPRLRNFRASRLASTREKLLFSVGRSERACAFRA